MKALMGRKKNLFGLQLPMHVVQFSTSSNAELDTHIQFPAQTDQSASNRFSKKKRNPSSHEIHRSPLVKKHANAFLEFVTH